MEVTTNPKQKKITFSYREDKVVYNSECTFCKIVWCYLKCTLWIRVERAIRKYLYGKEKK